MKKVLSTILSLAAVVAAVIGVLLLIKKFMDTRCCVEKTYDMYGNEVRDHEDCMCGCDDCVEEYEDVE